MFEKLTPYLTKPLLYENSTNQFWNDDHISISLLEAHLNTNWDAASRKSEFIDKSVSWIANLAPPAHFNTLLDLGCGPGLYAERFSNAGYAVTGIDFSKRSISYAKEQTSLNNSSIQYFYQDYLTLDYVAAFDIVTLIYCDYGVLSTTDRSTLLSKIYTALKPGGKLVLDVFTPKQHQGKEEKCDWQYHTNGGFWSKQKHLCLNSFYRYEEDNTILNQTVVIEEKMINCYNIWEHCFTVESLTSELQKAGFGKVDLYNDVAGKDHTTDNNIICAVLTK